MAKHTQTKPAPGILQIPPKFIAAASTDKTREVLNGILIDAQNRAVVACNGRILAKIPIPGTEPVRGGYITPELWKSATIMAKKGPVVLDYIAGTVASLPYQSTEEWGQNYPNWLAVMPQIEDPVFRTRLDPKLLLDCALALGYNPDTPECRGLTFDFAADHNSPILLNVTAAGSTGVIMPIGDPKNEGGHGLRIQSATPEHSPADHPAPGTPFDRSAMLKDPIAWLRLLDEELRYLHDLTPHGRYIFDYLTIGQTAREATALEEERDEAQSENESGKETIESHQTFLKRIIDSFESTTFDSIDSAAAFLHELKDMLTESDLPDSFDHPKIHHRLVSFEEITLPKSEADFESMKAERDQLKSQLATSRTSMDSITRELTQARSRIKDLESTSRHHAAPSTQPSPAPSARDEMPVATRPPTVHRNQPKNGIEIRFDGKPDDSTRSAMKALGFRWAPGQPDKPWIAKYSEERLLFALALADGKTAQSMAEPEIIGAEVSPEPLPSPQINPASQARHSSPAIFADF